MFFFLLCLLLTVSTDALKPSRSKQQQRLISEQPSQAKSSSKLGLSISPDSMIATTLRFAGPVMFTGMQISSLRTALGIQKAKSTGDLSPLPFTSLAVNCFVWTLYGILQKDLTVLIPNAYGTVIGSIAAVIYQKYSEQMHTKMYAAGALMCAGSVGQCSMYLIFVRCSPFYTYLIYINRNTIHSIINNIILWYFVSAAFKLFLEKNPSKIGLIGCSLAVLVCGSPLATLGTVLKNKSTAALPFANSFTTWLNALCWFSYGILVAHDIMIFGPNGVGLALASVQMLMFALFGLPP